MLITLHNVKIRMSNVATEELRVSLIPKLEVGLIRIE